MKLLTKSVKKQLNKSDKHGDFIVGAKFFTPWSNWTWYAAQYDEDTGVFWGYVVGNEKEVGHFSLKELESVNGPFGLKIERDRFFEPRPLSEIIRDF